VARRFPETTKGRIQRAASHLGYRPNPVARSLRGQRSHTVGVMVFDLTDPYCTLALRGIENTLYQSLFLPILTDVHTSASDSGAISKCRWTGASRDSSSSRTGCSSTSTCADLEKNNIPTAIVGRELKNDSISSVIVDNHLGARGALEHLYSLGHRKISFIRGPRQLSDTKPRWPGVQTLAHERQLEIDSQLIVDLPESGDPSSSLEQDTN